MISGVSKDMKYFLIVKPNCSDLPTLAGFHQSDPMLIECVQKLILPSSVSHEPKRLKTQPHFWSQYTMDKELLKLFNQTLNGIFLDIGAGGATQRSNTRLLEEHLGWTGLLVEPDPAQVQQLISQKRNVSILQMGVARGQYSEMAKYVYSHTLNGRMGYHLEKRFYPKFKMHDTLCVPLYSIIQAMNVPLIHYLSLNIVAEEDLIVKALPFQSVNLSVMSVTVTHLTDLGASVLRHLQANGFKLVARDNRVLDIIMAKQP